VSIAGCHDEFSVFSDLLLTVCTREIVELHA
jgi:hypothetical protein